MHLFLLNVNVGIAPVTQSSEYFTVLNTVPGKYYTDYCTGLGEPGGNSQRLDIYMYRSGAGAPLTRRKTTKKKGRARKRCCLYVVPPAQIQTLPRYKV